MLNPSRNRHHPRGQLQEGRAFMHRSPAQSFRVARGGSAAARRARPTPAHHDPVGVALADRELIDPDHLGPRRSGSPQLLAHVLLLELLDRVPCEPELVCDVPDRRQTAALADVVREALRVAGALGKEVQALALSPGHSAGMPHGAPRAAGRSESHCREDRGPGERSDRRSPTAVSRTLRRPFS